jgi:fumarate hydratase class II
VERIRADENRIREPMERWLIRVGTRPKSGYGNAAKVATSALGRGTALKQKAVPMGFVHQPNSTGLVHPERIIHRS